MSTQVAEGIKCPQCKMVLDRSCFTPQKQKSSGLSTYCRPCAASRAKARAALRRLEVVVEGYRKTCAVCRIAFGPEEFNKNSYTADGLMAKCRGCHKAYQAEQRRKIGKDFRRQTDLAVDGYKKCKHCKMLRAIGLFRKNENRVDGFCMYCRHCESEANKANYTKRDGAVYAKALYHSLKEQPNSVKYWRQRVRPCVYRGIDAVKLRDKFFDDPHCSYCGVAFSHPSEAWLEHFVSRANGGLNDIDNLGFACPQCNRMKGAMNSDEFKEYLMIFMRRLIKKYGTDNICAVHAVVKEIK